MSTEFPSRYFLEIAACNRRIAPCVIPVQFTQICCNSHHSIARNTTSRRREKLHYDFQIRHASGKSNQSNLAEKLHCGGPRAICPRLVLSKVASDQRRSGQKPQNRSPTGPIRLTKSAHSASNQTGAMVGWSRYGYSPATLFFPYHWTYNKDEVSCPSRA